MSNRGPKSMENVWKFGTCDFLFSVKSITFKLFFLHDQGCQKSKINNEKTMQLPCSKKVRKTYEECPKTDPKWEPKSRQILQKTRFKNVLFFWINFRRPLVPILLAKWSPTRRTSSRKPNKKGKQQGKGTPRTVFEAQHALACEGAISI